MFIWNTAVCLVIETMESMQDEPQVTNENKSTIQVTKKAQKDKEHDRGDTWPRKGHVSTLRSIHATPGGPYLCDSDSDVTVPITVVENLEMVEDSED